MYQAHFGGLFLFETNYFITKEPKMGKRNKRARTLLKKMSILNQIPDAATAKRYGIEEQVNARIRVEEENSLRIQKLKEAQEAEERAAKLKAEQEAKKATEAKKEAELKAKKLKEAKSKTTKAPAIKKTKTSRRRTKPSSSNE